MRDKHRKTFLTIVKALCLLALGALWAIVLRLIVSLPDPLSITVLVIIILICLIVLLVTGGDEDDV